MIREDGLANWPGAPGREPARLQWCTGAPGILAGAWDYLDEDMLLAGAELTWRAGAHGDEKGHGLCHGTSGNGFALLKAFARTGGGFLRVWGPHCPGILDPDGDYEPPG